MKSPTILIVEDNERMRRVLCSWLGEHFPVFALLENTDAETALRRASAPGLAIVDIGLPGMDGLQAARRMASLWPRVPVILISAFESDLYREQASAAGAVAFVPKRLLSARLAALINQHLLNERNSLS